MKQIETTQKQIITVLDAENDILTMRQEYFWNEFIPISVFDSDIFGIGNKKIASYCCFSYNYDNYTIITDNPILISLMIEAKRISTDTQVFENIANIDQKLIDNYHRIIS